MLAREPESISIADIVTSVDECIDVTMCAGRENCFDGERCLTHELWSELSSKIFEFLDEISLQELISRERNRECASMNKGLRNDGKAHVVFNGTR